MGCGTAYVIHERRENDHKTTFKKSANARWEKFLRKFRMDSDEDILWDMFLYLLPVE